MGLTPRENLKRDKYDMEDVDAFFEDEDRGTDATSGKRNSVNSQALRRSIVSGSASSMPSDTPRPTDNYKSLARRIDFTEAEAERFHLSVVPMADRPGKKDIRLPPLRSPLQNTTRGRTTSFDFPDHGEFDDDVFDINDDQQATLSPIPIPAINSPPAVSSITHTPTRPPTSAQPAKRGRGRPKKAASLTKLMALGHSSSGTTPKRVYLEFSLSDVDSGSEPSADIISPPPTTKRTKANPVQQAETIVRPSPLPSPPPDGLRRSRRTKIAPLAFWRNERIVYSRADEFEDKDGTLVDDIHKIPLQEIKEVVHIPERSNARTRGSLRGRNARGRARSYRKQPSRASSSDVVGSEWMDDDSLALDVFESADTNTRRSRRVAWAPNSVPYKDHLIESSDPELAENFKVATLFNEDRDFIACAMLELPVDGFKLLRSSAGSVYIFHVVDGEVEVTLNDLKFVVTRGCSFEVPRANIYGFKNLGSDAATLFFVQSQPYVGADESEPE